MRKIWTVAAVVLLAMLTAPGAEAVEQRAFALEETLTLYAKPDKEAKSWEVSLPESGVAVPSAIRDKEDMLWYKVKVDGRTGWLYQEGVRLRMGPKSKVAANLYKRYAAARLEIADKMPRGWTQEESVQAGDTDVETWTSKGAVFQISGEGKRAKDLGIAHSTAKYHVLRLYRTLGASSAAEALARAGRAGPHTPGAPS